MNVNLKDLPSRGLLIDPAKYPTLEIRKFSISELGMLSMAVSKDNANHLIEAVRSVINIPLKYLTIGDFYYILLALRTSFSSPISLNWTCDGYHYTLNGEFLTAPQARSAAEDPNNRDGKLVPHVCNTSNYQVFPFEAFDIARLPEGFKLEDLEEEFTLPNASLLAEYDRLSKDGTMTQLLPALQWIKPGNTLMQKLEWLKEQGSQDIVLFDKAAVLNEQLAHGPSDTIVGECTKCKTKVIQRIQLSAKSFFRTA